MAFRSTAMKPLLAGAALLVGATLSAPAMAADDGYQNVFSSVLTTVGVLPAPKSPDIDYRDRPALVLPKSMDLTQPAAGSARPASWPNDPDVIKARKANDKARAPDESIADKWHAGSLASRDELAAGRAQTTEDPQGDKQCGSKGVSEAFCERLSPDELRAQGERFKAANPEKKDEIVAGQEPDRLYLTQPPKGYMKATRTVKATTEKPVIQRDESSPYAGFIQRPKDEDE